MFVWWDVCVYLVLVVDNCYIALAGGAVVFL